MNKKLYVLTCLVLIAIIGAGFYAIMTDPANKKASDDPIATEQQAILEGAGEPETSTTTEQGPY